MKKATVSRILLSLAVIVWLFPVLSGCKSAPADGKIDTETSRNAEANFSAGWSAMLENDWRNAQISFSANIQHKAKTGESSRGMALAAFASENSFNIYPHLVRAVEHTPESPYTIALLKLVYSESPRNASVYTTLAAAVQKAERNKNIPEWARREYQEFLYTWFMDGRGLPEEARKYLDKLQLLDNWEFLGPFSNVSGQGFGTDYLTTFDREIFSGYERGLNNWELKPFRPKKSFPGLDVPVSMIFSPDTCISVYARRNILVEQTGRYVLTFARSGSIEAWLDGEKILNDGRYTNSENAFYFTRQLEKGTHRLFVKMNNRDDISSFRVAFSPAGADMDKVSAYYRSLFPDKNIFDPLVNAICLDIDNNINTGEARFWLAWMLLRRGWADTVYALLSDSNNGQSLLNEWLLALAVKDLSDEPDYEKRIFTLSENPVFFAPARRDAIYAYLADNRLQKADEIISEAEKINPVWLHALEARIIYHLRKGETQKARTAYQKIALNFGTSANSAILMFVYSDYLTTKQAGEYLDLFSQEGNYRTGLLVSYRFYRKRNYSEALDRLTHYLSLYPSSEKLWYEYIELLHESGKYEGIGILINDLVATFPFSYTLLHEQKDYEQSYYNSMVAFREDNSQLFSGGSSGSGQFMIEMNSHRDKYRACLKKLLACYPYTLELRDSLRELDDTTLISKDNEARDSFSIIQDFNESDTHYEDSEAVVVYDDRREFYFGDGGSTVFEHFILKILTDRGVKNNRYQYLEFHPAFGNGEVQEAFILKEDGTKINAERSGRKLAFPGLSAGDFIVVRYSVDSYVTGAINNEVWTSCTLSSVYPIYRKDFQLVYPLGCPVTSRFNNISQEQVRMENELYIADFRKISVHLEKVPAVKTSFLSPPWRDSIPWIDFSSIESWRTITKWYEDLYLGQTEGSHLLNRTTQELVKGLEDRNEIIKRIFDFVSAGIEYEDLDFQYSDYVPQTADSILREGYGDCKDQSVLLIAMLNVAGIDSYIVLNTPSYTGQHPYLPSPRFSHAIVAVPEEDSIMYLDPTTNSFTYREIPVNMVNSWVLPIRTDGELQRLEAETDDQRSYYLVELHNILNDTQVDVSVDYQGIAAAVFRSQFNGLPQSKEKDYFSFITNTWLPGFRLGTYDFANTENLDLDPTVRFSGRIPNPVSMAGNGSFRLVFPWINILDEQVKSWLTVPLQQEDMYVRGSAAATPVIQSIITHLPPGYKVTHLPKDVRYNYGGSYAVFSYKVRDNIVICTREILLENQVIPSGDANKFRAFIQNIISKEAEDVYIKR
ncbi:MAG: hypothetical protein JW874_13825 [Spirochaetales bacterium]|nr:hypothetical protein [Spirochaetales bacterium]